MRIGIFSGTFDPVHSGHVGFALQALKETRLDKVVFVPERSPRGKHGITHFIHRLAMLKIALRAYPKLKVLELPDQRFYPRTITRFTKLYPGDELFLLLGSDTIYGLKKWPHVELLLKSCGLIVGIRGADQMLTIKELLATLPETPPELTVLLSQKPDISSREIREALIHHHKAKGLLTSVQKYSKQHWLYHSLETRN